MNEITIIGLGASDLDQLPLGIYKKLKAAEHLYVRTEQHPVLQELKAEGLTWTSFDAMYEKNDQFEGVYEEIVETLLRLAQETSSYICSTWASTSCRTNSTVINRSRETRES